MQRLILLLLIISSCMAKGEFFLPRVSHQVVVGKAKGWNSSHVTLQMYVWDGRQWVVQTEPWAGRLGRNGLARGLGIHPLQKGKRKVEGDGRSPAGVFLLGGAWGYDAQIQKHSSLPYRQITTRDLWVEDSNSKYYNQHLILPHEPKTKWEKEAQMRQGDYAHSLKLFIKHNASPNASTGTGSAIFFHIWRGGGSKATAGCTTMNESKLRMMIKGVDPKKNPTFVLLPESEYAQFKKAWQLP